MDDYNSSITLLNTNIMATPDVFLVPTYNETSQPIQSSGPIHNTMIKLGEITNEVKTNLLSSPLLLLGGVAIICLLIL